MPSFDFAGLLTVDAGLALLALTAMEIILGIDNIVFIAILTQRLDPRLQPRARRIGLMGAMIMRILLLLAIGWIMQLTEPLFELFGEAFSARDLILIGGGLFLLAKATLEIHHRVEEARAPDTAAHASSKPRRTWLSGFAGVIVQIMLLDLVFSLDSVITAVGMADRIEIMIIAVVLAVLVMMIFAEVISSFIEKHPTLKILALSFLVLIGVMLMLDGIGAHVSKGYIYFAMGFSLGVEMLNMWAQGRPSRIMSGEPV